MFQLFALWSLSTEIVWYSHMLQKISSISLSIQFTLYDKSAFAMNNLDNIFAFVCDNWDTTEIIFIPCRYCISIATCKIFAYYYIKRSISKCIINWYLILTPIVWNFILKIHSIHDPNTLCIKTYRIVRLMKIFKTHKCPYKKDYIFCDIFKARHHQCNSLLIDLNHSLSHPSLHSSSLSLSLSLSLHVSKTNFL